MYDGKLTNWTMSGGVIVGMIYNDQKNRFADGAVVTTSPVHSILTDKWGNLVAHTANSTYVLG